MVTNFMSWGEGGREPISASGGYVTVILFTQIFSFFLFLFLAVQNSSIGDLVPCLLGLLVGLSGTANNQSLHNTTE